MEIILSFTTTPDRIHHIEPMLQSLKRQKALGQRIWLWLCHHYSRSGQTMSKTQVPDFVHKYGVEVHFTEDFGSNTKLLPTVQAIQDPDTILITVDDDTLYPEHWLEGLVQATKKDSSRAYGYRGKIFTPKRAGFFFRPTLKYKNTKTVMPGAKEMSQLVDLLTGVWGICYRRSFFTESYLNLDQCPAALHNDDIWVNGQLARLDIKRLCLPSPGNFHDIDMESVGIRRLWDSVNNGKGLNDKVLDYFRKDFEKSRFSS